MAGNDFPVKFGKVAAQLHSLGWRPIPCLPDTKRPALPGWQQSNTTPLNGKELSLFVRQYGDHACGLVVPKELFVLDIDITDEIVVQDVVAIAENILGKTPLLRIGMAPKVVLVYRSDGSTKSTKPHPIEIFSGTGQFLAFGIHSKTSKPYSWPDLSPLDLDVTSEKIPIVDWYKQKAFLEATAHITKPRGLGARRTSLKGRSVLEPNDPGEILRDWMRRGLTIERACRKVLQLAVVGQRHACVRAVISAGYNHGWPPALIQDFIERHTDQDALDAVNIDRYLERTLVDFAPKTRRVI